MPKVEVTINFRDADVDGDPTNKTKTVDITGDIPAPTLNALNALRGTVLAKLKAKYGPETVIEGLRVIPDPGPGA
jgi:hypothetical protein